ncbi:MAG: glycosyltransferase [Clostridia bacterium]|nr:glycosyltransferase [Clostridia bacterium]
MKIVQINCSSTGSTGNIAKEIQKKLLANGDESYIFYGIGSSDEKNMFRIGNYFDLHLHAVLSRNLGMQGYFSYTSTKKLIKKLNEIAPDIIHLHNLHGSYINLSLLFNYLKLTKTNVVITLHDCWLFTGKCPHFTEKACYKWKQNCGNCPQLAIYPRSKVDTTSKCLRDKKKWLSGFKNRMRIVAVSNWLRDTAKQSYLSQYPIETVYNGVDTCIFHPVSGERVRKKYSLGDKYIILGVSSNWNEQKGLNDFLKLSNQISENEIIVLVGLSERQISQMPSNVVGIKRTENKEELAELYSAANVFVNTSKEETFGLVTAEAMSCGTPVVVYNSTACAEIVNNENGYILNPEQSDLLIYYIRKAKEKVFPPCSEYTNERMVDKYISLYRSIKYGE